jgi:hypothetical protein
MKVGRYLLLMIIGGIGVLSNIPRLWSVGINKPAIPPTIPPIIISNR